MAASHSPTFYQYLRRTVLLPDGAGLSDGQLLECFLTRRDDAAFAALVHRHGPMVWGVCRRILHNHHDAEDAFQATFLVLVRKAASVQPRDKVANWLYGVAYQTSHRARVSTAKRQKREQLVASPPESAAVERDLGPNLRGLLDQELRRLPDKYRTPIILCDLEGKSGQEAARQLGCPEGTLTGRLSRARAMLAKRLARSGLGLSAGALATALAENAASGCVPPAVLSSTIQAAALMAKGKMATTGVISAQVAALTKGVLTTMLLTKLKNSMIVVLLLSIVSGMGVVTYSALGKQADGRKEEDKKVLQQPRRDQAQEELAKLQGTWLGVRLEANGQAAPVEQAKQFKILIKEDKVVFNPETEKRTSTLKLDLSRKPHEMHLTPLDGPAKKETAKAIYSLEKDELTICVNNVPGGPPPTKFETKSDPGLRLLVLEREKKAEKAKPTATENGTEDSREVDPLSVYPHSEGFTADLAWHKEVGENEIRMSWFLRGEPRIAMICKADLSASKVFTARAVHNWAVQASAFRQLSQAQVTTLRNLAKNLPPSAKTPELKNLLLVSISEKGHKKTYLYNRLDPPRDIIRLYDLTGAFLDTNPVP